MDISDEVMHETAQLMRKGHSLNDVRVTTIVSVPGEAHVIQVAGVVELHDGTYMLVCNDGIGHYTVKVEGNDNSSIQLHVT